MVDMASVMTTALPLLKMIVYAIGGIILLGAAYYFFFHILGVKKWSLRIYEITENGKLTLKFFDTLIEKKVMGGKRRIYWLKKAKVLTNPPGSELCQNVGGKDYADYLRIDRDVFAPMPSVPIHLTPDIVDKYAKLYDKQKKEIAGLTTEQVRERYIYLPLNKSVKLNLKYDISYDVDQMRMNAIDLRDLMWQGTKAFWEKYGTMIVGALMLICIIAIAVLSYEHIQKTMAAQVDLCSKGIQEGIAQGIRQGGTPPPS